MFTADRSDDPLLDQVRAQLGQAPADERQTQGCGRLAGPPPDGGDWLAGQARRSPRRARSAQGGQAVPCEIASIGIHGIDLCLDQLGDDASGETGGMEQENFGTTTLPGLQGFLQPSMDLAEFARARFADIQRTRHGWASGG